jgi:hypothetical protein
MYTKQENRTENGEDIKVLPTVGYCIIDGNATVSLLTKQDDNQFTLFAYDPEEARMIAEDLNTWATRVEKLRESKQ